MRPASLSLSSAHRHDPALPARVRLVAQEHDPFPEIDGTSAEMCGLKREMLRVAHDGLVTVLVAGESGTGKERVAEAIHRISPRAAGPFVVVNCAGLSPTLVEDELFGHVRGAFTGAIADQPGPFERAHGGTVFLDEVGELTLDAQVKLLRALQQRRVQRLGARREVAFDVRVIAASHVDLAAAVARGRFREDLYYRLKVYELRVPALRRRGEADLRLLADAILVRLARRRHRVPPVLDAEVLRFFAQYAWPGNVRELENTLERMAVAAEGEGILVTDHLPEGFGTVAHGGRVSMNRGDRLLTPPSDADVRTALAQHSGRRGRAAVELGLSRHQLYRLIKKREVPAGNASA